MIWWPSTWTFNRASVADEVEAAIRARFGDTPKRVGGPPKRLLLYAAKKPGTKITSPWYRTADGLEHRLEILGIGQQFVAHGSRPENEGVDSGSRTRTVQP